MQHDIDISVIVPLYNEEESLPELCTWISRVMKEHGFTYEVLLVDDGSKDRSWAVVRDIFETNPHIRGIRFNRNHGKSAALNSGFKNCRGRVVITMDADLQDSPDEIPELYRMITQEGYDLVSGWKQKRYDPISKTIPSKFFNWVTGKISDIKLHDFNCGLKAYRSEVVKNVDIYGEMHRYIPVIAKWRGFSSIGEKPVAHQARKYGTTKFGLERFVYGFLDLLSITFVSKFKQRPMHFFGALGTLSFLLGFFFTMYILGEKLYYIYVIQHQLARDVTEQPLFFLALIALVIGVQLFLAGFIAEMLVMQNAGKRDQLIIERVGIE
jgi:glycosyltransferase involved in cell wall biosynthesis